MTSHAGHNHPATPAARATCRKLGLDAKIRIEADGTASRKVVTPEIKMTGATARKLARHASKADMLRNAR